MHPIEDWRAVYPEAVRDERVFQAFINAGLEPPRQEIVDQIGYTGREQAVISGLVRSITEQGLEP